MLKLSCLCGVVRLAIKMRPDYMHECNCALCAKTGARWGYFDPSQIRVDGSTTHYSREDKKDPTAEIHFCARCGSTTHWTLTASAISKHGNTLMGVNMWLAEESDLAGIELRYPDGQGWSGDGAFGYVRQARIIGQ